MKKKIILLVLLLFFSVSVCQAAESTIFDLRKKFFDETKTIRSMVTANTLLLATGIVDSCLMTVREIDAFAKMSDLLNSINKDALVQSNYDFLIQWLGEMKVTAELDLKALAAENLPAGLDPKIKARLEVLSAYYSTLNKAISNEVNRISALRKSVKAK